MIRALRLVVRNWPLKLGAVVLATLLYSGLVLSQTTREFSGGLPIIPINQPTNVTLLTQLGNTTLVRYVAPADLGLRIDAQSFKATIDLAGVDPSQGHVTLPVTVTALDDRVQVLDVQPSQITIQLDRVTSETVPIKAVTVGTVPPGLDVGTPILDQSTATVTGPQGVVSKVAEVDALVTIDPSGIDVDRTIDLVAVDASGAQLAPIDIEPASVHVRIPIFTDRRTRTVPVGAVVVGTPAAGFEIESVTVDPVVVQVQGDANDLAGLDLADTTAVSVTGASADVVQRVPLALPSGVQALGDGSVEVTVKLRAVTSARTFDAGLVLVGASPDHVYTLSTSHVLVTIGGSATDLDRLGSVSVVLSLDVTGLDVGDHKVVPSANLTTGLTLLSISPSPVIVTIAAPAPSPT
jgi:YbbR domain-containing protein